MKTNCAIIKSREIEALKEELAAYQADNIAEVLLHGNNGHSIDKTRSG